MRTEKVSIHVIEDDKVMNKLLCNYLKKQGFKKVLGFESGKKYLEKVKKTNAPDIAVVDYRLGNNVLGTQVIQRIKMLNKRSQMLLVSSFFDEQSMLLDLEQKMYTTLQKSGNYADRVNDLLHTFKNNYLIAQQKIAVKAIALFSISYMILLYAFYVLFINKPTI